MTNPAANPATDDLTGNSPGTNTSSRATLVASRWLVFGIVGGALMMGSIDQTIVSTALPTLHRALGASISWTSWTITAYSLGVIVALPVVGRIADQYGRKRVFLQMVLIFTVSSLLCGLATNIYMLIALRVLQAVGGGAFMPAAVGIVSDRFAGDRDRAIGLFTSIFPIGALIGPVLGGTIIEVSSWRSIFLINVPIGCLLLLLGHRFLPSSPRRAGARADVLGTVLLGVTLVALMYGITELGGAGSSLVRPTFLIAEGIALGTGTLLLRHLRSADNPIIPIHLLRRRAFATMNFISFAYGGGMQGFAALVPLYAQDRFHFHPFEAGTVLTARAIGSVAVAGATAFVLRRIGYRIPMVIGFSGCALGLAMLFLAPRGMSAFEWVAIGAMVMGVGGGMASPAANNAVLSQAPDEIAAVSGLRGMFRLGGGIVAISITSAIVSRSADPGLTLAHSFLVFAIFIGVVIVPMVFTVPRHRGTW